MRCEKTNSEYLIQIPKCQKKYVNITNLASANSEIVAEDTITKNSVNKNNAKIKTTVRKDTPKSAESFHHIKDVD